MLEARHLACGSGDHLAPVEVLAAVAVAVDREQHLRLDLREAVDDAARAPKSGEQHDQIAPMLARGEERDDRLGDVRQVGDDPVAALDPERAQARRERAPTCVAQLAPAQLAERPQLRGVDDRRRAVGPCRRRRARRS